MSRDVKHASEVMNGWLALCERTRFSTLTCSLHGPIQDWFAMIPFWTERSRVSREIIMPGFREDQNRTAIVYTWSNELARYSVRCHFKSMAKIMGSQSSECFSSSGASIWFCISQDSCRGRHVLRSMTNTLSESDNPLIVHSPILRDRPRHVP
jgi:hypothetical protein